MFDRGSSEGAGAQVIALETAVEDKPSAALEPTATELAALGLALSEGGVRAALFSLGVVIGLIETGCNRGCVAWRRYPADQS
jgi:hypothetical protein